MLRAIQRQTSASGTSTHNASAIANAWLVPCEVIVSNHASQRRNPAAIAASTSAAGERRISAIPVPVRRRARPTSKPPQARCQ